MEQGPNRLTNILALNRTVAVVLVSVLLFGLGEELWRNFLPVYLNSQAKGVAHEAITEGQVSPAALLIVGLFACALNLFEAFCYISGGQLTARLGDRGSLFFFGLLTLTGYVLFFALPILEYIT